MKTHLLAHIPILDIELRLNVWLSGAEGPDDGPHEHTAWHVAVPLWGTFVEKRFVRERDSSLDHFLRHRTPIGLRFLRARFRWPLRPYLCRRDVVHSLMPIDSNSAAAIVLSGRPR